MLSSDSITFGKYKGSNVSQVLRDRSYCRWLLEQEWFITSYEYLYNRVKEYDPRVYFLNPDEGDPEDFIDSYIYFNLTGPANLQIDLNTIDKTCYEYYLRMIQEIKNKVLQRFEDEEENPYDIKAPTSWLKRFEKEAGMPRECFKDFISAYELPNIPYVIERVKKEGGIEYKGARGFLIAKARSKAQEEWWEEMLKKKYGENLGTQFKYERCIFDFIVIKTNTILECKLNLSCFDEKQYQKYKLTLGDYRIIYLIDRDCVVHLESKYIYTTNVNKYIIYLANIPSIKNQTYLDAIIQDFSVIKVEDLSTIFN